MVVRERRFNFSNNAVLSLYFCSNAVMSLCRSKLAKEEANKLTKVQKELSHLDSLVNADVSIIRDKIEAASIDFLQAQCVHFSLV